MLINYEEETLGFLDITFGPKWDYIPLTKNFVENFLNINSIDKNSVSKISMSVSELLENAVKYSTKDGIRLYIKKNTKDKKIELKVYSFLTPEKASVLVERIDDMNKEDPLQYYIRKMRETLKLAEGQTELGLARINYEGQARIDAKFYDTNNVIEISVFFKIE